MMLRCRYCHSPVVRAAVSLRHSVGEQSFVAEAMGRPCGQCGADGVDDDARRQFTLLVASQLTHATGGSVKFIREALRLKAADLAALLDVSIETLSRWENDRIVIPRAAYTVLAALARDALDGREWTLEMLRALAHPSRAKRKVSVALTGARRKRSSGRSSG